MFKHDRHDDECLSQGPADNLPRRDPEYISGTEDAWKYR
jgi:hypothetical protein